MYPFRSKCENKFIGAVPVSNALKTLLDFPNRYQHHRAEKTYWECRIISQTSQSITLQLIDTNFERPRGQIKHRDLPLFHINFSEDATGSTLHYDYRWKIWKLIFTAFSMIVQVMTLIYTILSFSQLSLQDLVLFLLLWGSMTILLLCWLTSNARHDTLALQVFKALLDKNFPNT